MKYLGIDWGLRNLGFAASEGMLATPLKEVSINSLPQAVDQVSQIVKTEGIDVIIIGIPESGEARKAVEKAYSELIKLGYKVELADETLTTQNSKDHKTAAALILQEYLDNI
jgi:RNase H-fold protein (predicted Holliday junction resolvase)